VGDGDGPIGKRRDPPYPFGDSYCLTTRTILWENHFHFRAPEGGFSENDFSAVVFHRGARDVESDPGAAFLCRG